MLPDQRAVRSLSRFVSVQRSVSELLGRFECLFVVPPITSPLPRTQLFPFVAVLHMMPAWLVCAVSETLLAVPMF